MRARTTCASRRSTIQAGRARRRGGLRHSDFGRTRRRRMQPWFETTSGVSDLQPGATTIDSPSHVLQASARLNNVILLLACFGIVLRASQRLPEGAPAALNGFVVNVSLPALTL